MCLSSEADGSGRHGGTAARPGEQHLWGRLDGISHQEEKKASSVGGPDWKG